MVLLQARGFNLTDPESNLPIIGATAQMALVIVILFHESLHSRGLLTKTVYKPVKLQLTPMSVQTHNMLVKTIKDFNNR